jgi:hypothetical protein
MNIKFVVRYILKRRSTVWSFQGLINSIVLWFKHTHIKKDILYYCHDVHRFVIVEGKLYSPLIDVLHQHTGEDRGLSCVAPFSKLLAANCFINVKNYNLPVLIGLLMRLVCYRNICLTTIENDPVINAYSYIFRKIGCRVVVAVQPSIEMCIAAKHQGIKIFDLQHGVIAGAAYYSLNRRSKFLQAGWPDAVLCWDLISRKRVLSESGGCVKAVLVGHPAFATDEGRKLLNFPGVTGSQNGDYSLIILVSLAWHEYGDRFEDKTFEVLGIPIELVQLIQRMKSVFFRIRLHPVQSRYSRLKVMSVLEQIFADCLNVNFLDFNDCYIGAAFAGCGGHITVSSAASIEAWQLRIRTLLVEGYGSICSDVVENYFSDYIRHNVMTRIDRYSVLSLRESELLHHFNARVEDDVHTHQVNIEPGILHKLLLEADARC